VSIDVYKEWLGIPEGPRPPDHYTLLRLVRFEDDVQKIRDHYKKLNAHVRKYATGQYSVESQKLLNELAKAMLCLTDPERKREYDESLGRVVEAKKSVAGRQLLQDWLVEQGHITPEQKKEAERFASARGLSMRDAVVQMKLVSPEVAAMGLAEELGYSYVDLRDTFPDDSVLDRVPRSLVKRNTILPLFVDEDCLLVACADQPTAELEEELRLIFGVPIRPVIATPLAINQAIAKYYAPGVRDEAVAAASGDGGAATQPKKAEKPKKAKKPASQLSESERQQRKMIGTLIICWTIIGTVLLGMYLPWESIVARYLPMILVTPAVAWYVFKVYWK